MPTVQDWDAAGLTDEYGRLHRPVPTTRIWVPKKVEVHKQDLRWSDLDSKWVRPSTGLLEGFVDLTSNGGLDEGRVVRYARRWGVLGICKHRLPYTHNPSRPGYRGCLPLGANAQLRTRLSGELYAHEPLAAWDGASRRARAILNIAARLHEQQRGAPDDWQALSGVHEVDAVTLRPVLPSWWPQSVAAERAHLGRVVSDWLELGDVRAVVSWSAERPELLWDVRGLFGAIALQLALTVAKADALAICTHCSSTFAPTRKPVEGRRRFCPSCRDQKIPMRYVMADRQRSGKRERKVQRVKARKR